MPGVLEQLETSFQELTAGPQPQSLVIDGCEIGHRLPARVIPLAELRELLEDPATPAAAGDAALRVLIGRARAERGAALLGLVGVLLPGVRREAGPILRAARRWAADVEAEILAGLLAAISTIRLGGRRLAARLIARGVGAGRRLLAGVQAVSRAEPTAPLPGALPGALGGSPGVLLAEALQAGVLSPGDVGLVGARLARVPFGVVAARRGVAVGAVRRRWQRIEADLRAWLMARPGLAASPGGRVRGAAGGA